MSAASEGAHGDVFTRYTLATRPYRLFRRLHLAEVSRILQWFGHVVLQSTFRGKRRFLTLLAQQRGLDTVGNHGMRDGHERVCGASPRYLTREWTIEELSKSRYHRHSAVCVHQYTDLAKKVNTKTERVSGFFGGDRRSHGWGVGGRERREYFSQERVLRRIGGVAKQAGQC